MQLIGRRALDASTLTQAEETALRAHVKARVTTFQDQLCSRLQAAASGSGSVRKPRQLFRGMMASNAVRLSALIAAQQRLPPSKRASMAECISLIGSVDPWERRAQAHTWPQPKSPGSTDTRRLNSFEHVDRACQTLIRLGLTPFARACPTRSCHPGQVLTFGGTPNACDALRGAMQNAPASACFLHLDIRSYFDSVAVGVLGEITGLPPEIIHNQVALVLGKEGRRKPLYPLMVSMEKSLEARSTPAADLPGTVPAGEMGERGFSARETDRRRFLPQGSAVSPIVAEMVMGRVLRDIGDLPPCLFFRVYSDNIGVLTSSREEALAFKALLQSALLGHKAGPFSTTGTITSLHRPFVYLGHRWVRGAKGRVTADPGKRLRRWEAQFLSELMVLDSGADHAPSQALDNTAAVVALFRSVASYAGGFPAWTGASRQRWVQRLQDDALCLLSARCRALGVACAELTGRAQLSNRELSMVAGAEERSRARVERRARCR